MALFPKKQKEQPTLPKPDNQTRIRPNFRLERNSLVEFQNGQLCYISSFKEFIGEGFWIYCCNAPYFENPGSTWFFCKYENIPTVVCSEMVWRRLYPSETEFLEALRKSYAPSENVATLQADRHSALCNLAYWEWFGKNNLAVHINKRKDGDWYADLCSIFSGYEVYVKGDGVLFGACGDGQTPEDAFQNMLRRYSGKTLRICHWEGEEYKPVDIQFPIILINPEGEK